MKAYLTLEHGQQPLGTLHIDLFDQTVPKTVTNFVTLLERLAGKGYRGCTFHRIIKGFMAQGGDFTAGDGTGGKSIYEKEMFPDENFTHSHVRAGTLSMANSGPHTNGSQFFITFKATPHLNGKHVVFGQLDLTQSADVLDALERIPTQPQTNRPRQPVTIVDCGIVSENSSQVEKVANSSSVEDQDEIDIDDVVDVSHPTLAQVDDDAVEEDTGDDDKPAPTKAEAIKQRLRKLKQKMNQARQLNKQAVREEGQRIADPEKERRRLALVAKQAKQAAWEATNAKALAISSETGVDAKALTEPGADSVRMARVKADKSKLNRFQINDYHNPESQHRNYQRNLKSIPSSSVGSQSRTTVADSDFGDDAIYNPLDSLASNSGASQQQQHEREGARRIASELHRRIEKRQERDRKRKQRDIQSGAADEASGINARNKRFNEKINRTYDKQTAEIRQNLERGTAL